MPKLDGVRERTGSTAVEERHVLATAWEVLHTIEDPCSIAFGCPISLVEMDLVRSVERRDGLVEVTIQLTEPTCAYTFRIGEEIRSRLRARLGEEYVVEVHLAPPDLHDVWTEERISPAARARMVSSRDRKREEAGLPRRSLPFTVAASNPSSKERVNS